MKLERHFECLAYKGTAPNFKKRVFAKYFKTVYIKFISVNTHAHHKDLKPYIILKRVLTIYLLKYLITYVHFKDENYWHNNVIIRIMEDTVDFII